MRNCSIFEVSVFFKMAQNILKYHASLFSSYLLRIAILLSVFSFSGYVNSVVQLAPQAVETERLYEGENTDWINAFDVAGTVDHLPGSMKLTFSTYALNSYNQLCAIQFKAAAINASQFCSQTYSYSHLYHPSYPDDIPPSFSSLG